MSFGSKGVYVVLISSTCYVADLIAGPDYLADCRSCPDSNIVFGAGGLCFPARVQTHPDEYNCSSAVSCGENVEHCE